MTFLHEAFYVLLLEKGGVAGAEFFRRLRYAHLLILLLISQSTFCLAFFVHKAYSMTLPTASTTG